ncbi:MAG TPA: transglycosylase domain-containing protein [Virgibacillus sp.]|nr:transglycosylase domain-containing protein [Virgibacillus sp.]HLR67272.1 transglycosylase domain-containing protein [Virgibacillus sp.]
MKRKLGNFLKKHLLLTGILSTMLIGFCFIIGVYFISFLLGPPNLMNQQNTVYYSNSEEVIGEENGYGSRFHTDLDEISPYLIDAAIAVEDRHFYEHNGFDFKRILGAIIDNIKNLSLKEGASTISQQLARNLYLSHEKTWTRKLKEAFYTIRLEMYYSKDEILTAYLNTIYYGHGAYGIEEASNYFFNKSAGELDLAEAAMLAGIPKGPSYYSPFNNMEKATDRKEHILELLLRTNQISEDEYNSAINEKLKFAKTEDTEEDTIAPYFQDMVLEEAAALLDHNKEAVRSGGYQIFTTLDIKAQKKLENAVEKTIHPASDIETSAIAMDPSNGSIRALIGGRDYKKSSFNRAHKAKRMPGSTFKPFLYYAALNNGYTPSTKLLSKPTVFELDNGEVYEPSNFNGYYADKPITLAQALALSDNIFAVKTNMYLGSDKLVETARDFGITSKLPAVPSLALGTATVSVEEMVAGYGMLANGGKEIASHTIEKIVDPQGNVLLDLDDKEGEQILDPKQTFILTHLMTGMFDTTLNGYMAVTGSTITDQLTRTYAGKSGSTDGDSWMIGYSPSLVTGVWTGYDDNRPIEVVKETTYAKNIWATFMEAAHQELPDKSFSVPDGIIGVRIDPETGKKATSYCPTSRMMYFEKGKEPKSHCTTHFPGGKNKKEKEEKGKLERLFDLFR